MDQSPRTSFIPKQTPGFAPKRQHRTFNVLSFVAMVVFLASLVLAAFVFFYGKYSDEQLVARKTELAELKDSFSESDITSIRALERRLNAAKELLAGHIALSRVFDALETQTQSQAQFSSFDYARLPSGSGMVRLAGRASTFNTVALQEQRFAGERAFESGSVVFSDLNIENGDTGTDVVTFTVSADLDEESVSYTATESATEVPAQNVLPATQTATTTDEVVSEEVTQ